ncbi:hypothetical protein RFI_11981 [Reticulomyxa filosa]|uniref:LamG-like jellyroll fold domain-containing protein n=1 Tax=Reticulomyxa filosa TaxID=46433 RepID=X6NHD9_RETFI|nr:hypothetical protein RFI_11981 [Reticulomyxa filosa]|eukprot:ETO25164.1 hypothetical protein RFI_11981 [Reticulomyxa filosa]
MECWLRFPNSETRQGPQQIFQHGDGSYSTYLYIQNQQIYCGSSTINGTSTGYASGQADLSQWTHLAVTYDVADTIWRIYVNGMLSTGHSYPTGANCMPQANGKNWTVGSIPGRPFFGQICDVRIWSCARSEDQIKKGLKARVEEIVTQEHLRGFWPCNDGLGLIVRDLSSFKNHGFMKDCEWKNEPRPYLLRISSKEPETYQSFPPRVAATTSFYTNGETLVIAYPERAFWNRTYGGVAQKFSLESGLLLDELEYDGFTNVESACFAGNGKSMWLLAGGVSNTSATCHSMQAPTTLSQWRAERMEKRVEEIQETTPKKLLKRYGLLGVDIQPTANGKTQIRSRRYNDGRHCRRITKCTGDTLELQDEVSATLALSNILVKIDNDCESLQTVDTLDSVPMSLSIPFGVDLTSQTFEALLEITERLADEFYAKNWALPKDALPLEKDKLSDDFSDGNLEEVRMLALLTVIRVLRTNITHLVTWNVDPKSCGFNKRKVDEMGMEIPNTPTVRERYVTLLNRLVFDRPHRETTKALEDEVHTEVAECLSIGLSVFYMDPIDRVGILFDHVEGCLNATSANPLRLLLASRYFDSLTRHIT